MRPMAQRGICDLRFFSPAAQNPDLWQSISAIGRDLDHVPRLCRVPRPEVVPRPTSRGCAASHVPRSRRVARPEVAPRPTSRGCAASHDPRLRRVLRAVCCIPSLPAARAVLSRGHRGEVRRGGIPGELCHFRPRLGGDSCSPAREAGQPNGCDLRIRFFEKLELGAWREKSPRVSLKVTRRTRKTAPAPDCGGRRSYATPARPSAMPRSDTAIGSSAHETST